MANTMSKSELIQRIVEGHPNEIARKDVKGVIEAVAEIGHKELKKAGAFMMPGLAKFIVIKRPPRRRVGYQSVHKRANDLQGEAGSQDH